METQNELSITDDLVIHKIYLIRGQKVILDKDLANLYQVETKQLKRQVNRNRERFPEDFMFELNESEHNNLRRQLDTSSWGGTRYLPMAFTEYGILMLSSVLTSPKAIQVNIQIVRIFSRIRKEMIDNTELRLAVEEIRRKTDNNTENIEVVFSYFDELLNKNKDPERRKKIGYKTPGS